MAQAKSALPLLVRKALRDVEPEQKKAIAEIEEEFKLSGVTFQCDFAQVYSELPESDRANIHHIIDSYLTSWLPNMKSNNLLTDLNRAAILHTWTTKKIIFRLNPDAEHYVHCLFENGNLIIQCKPNRFWCNISECGGSMPDNASTGSDYPLGLERNFAEYEGAKQENIQKIEQALGASGFTVEMEDWKAMAKAATEARYEDRLGEICFSWYLGGLADNLKKLCADDMVQEAIREAIANKKILFRVNPNCKKSYHDEFFENGNLIIDIKTSQMCSNVGTTGEDLATLL